MFQEFRVAAIGIHFHRKSQFLHLGTPIGQLLVQSRLATGKANPVQKMGRATRPASISGQELSKATTPSTNSRL